MYYIYIVDGRKSTAGLERIMEYRNVGIGGEHMEERVLNKVETRAAQGLPNRWLKPKP